MTMQIKKLAGVNIGLGLTLKVVTSLKTARLPHSSMSVQICRPSEERQRQSNVAPVMTFAMDEVVATYGCKCRL